MTNLSYPCYSNEELYSKLADKNWKEDKNVTVLGWEKWTRSTLYYGT